MLRHVVLLTLSDDTPEGQPALIKRELMRLPALLPQIKRYEVGIDAGISDGNATIAVIGEFENEADYRSYASNAEHVRIISEHIKPHAAARSAVQYFVD